MSLVVTITQKLLLFQFSLNARGIIFRGNKAHSLIMALPVFQLIYGIFAMVMYILFFISSNKISCWLFFYSSHLLHKSNIFYALWNGLHQSNTYLHDLIAFPKLRNNCQRPNSMLFVNKVHIQKYVRCTCGIFRGFMELVFIADREIEGEREKSRRRYPTEAHLGLARLYPFNLNLIKGVH